MEATPTTPAPADSAAPAAPAAPSPAPAAAAAPTAIKGWFVVLEDNGFLLKGNRVEDNSEVKTGYLVRGKDIKDKEGRIYKLEGAPNADELKKSGFLPSAIEKLTNAASHDSLWNVISKERREMELREQLQHLNWRDLPFIGVELKSVEDMYAEPFEFPDLEKQFGPGGKLHGLDHPVYFFLSAQPMLLADTVHNVPYLVAIDCKVPPPSLLASHSIQAAREEVIPMKETKVDWLPYIPKELRSKATEGLKVQLYILGWNERKVSIKKMNEEKLHSYEYYHPYIILPQLAEKEAVREVTQVTFDYEADGKKYPVVFDKEVDRSSEFIPDFLEEHKLAEEHADKLKDAIKAAFVAKRAQEKEAFESKQKQLADLPPEHIEALRHIKLYKFYPSHPAIDTRPFVSDLINPYFGNAHDSFAPNFVPGPYEKPKKKEEQKEEKDVVSPPKGKRARTESIKAKKSEEEAKPADANDVPMAASESSPTKKGDGADSKEDAGSAEGDAAASAKKKTPSRSASKRSASARGTPATPATRTPSARAAKSASSKRAAEEISESNEAVDDESSSTPRKRKARTSSKK